MDLHQFTSQTPPTHLRPKHDLRRYTEDGGLKLFLHEGQIEAMNSTARFIAIISGTQGGKTSFAPHWLLREIRIKGNGDYLYVSPTFMLMEKKALPEFLEVFETRGRLGKFRGGTNTFVFSEKGMDYIHGKGNYDIHRPTTVFFGHAQNANSLESATAKGAVLDEAGQKEFKLDAWEAILRRLSLNQGRVLIATTPYNLGWLYSEVWKRWKNGDPLYHVINFTSLMNPNFPPEEYERARRTLPKWKFDMFYRGLFTRPAGLIYDCFDETKNTCEPFRIPDHWLRLYGIDFGGINTAVTYFAFPREFFTLPDRHPNKRVYLYREYLPKEMLITKQHVANIRRGEPESSRFRVVGGASSEGQWRKEFRSHGLPIKKPTISEVEVGIDRVYSAVVTGHLVVFKDCKHTLEEFATYSREVNENGEVEDGTIENKSMYHCLDAVRYGLSYLLNPKQVWTTEDFRKFDPDAGMQEGIRSAEPESRDFSVAESEYKRWVKEREGKFIEEGQEVDTEFDEEW